MKVTIDVIMDNMKHRYSPSTGQDSLYIGDLDVGRIITRGKRVGLSNKITKEWMFRRNPSIGINEELFAGNANSLKRKIASAVVRHVKEEKLDPALFGELPSEEDEESFSI